jgi:hypothetical protein
MIVHSHFTRMPEEKEKKEKGGERKRKKRRAGGRIGFSHLAV